MYFKVALTSGAKIALCVIRMQETRVCPPSSQKMRDQTQDICYFQRFSLNFAALPPLMQLSVKRKRPLQFQNSKIRTVCHLADKKEAIIGDDGT